MTLRQLNNLLYDCYSSETCYPKLKDEWTIENKTLGHCAVTSLIVNDYFGGKIAKCNVQGISHYFNIIDDEIIDLTKEQFGENEPDYDNYNLVSRNDIVDNENTRVRYEKLKNKLALLLIDYDVYKCSLCNDLVENNINSYY